MEADTQQRIYARPTGRISRLFYAGLGDIPSRMPDLRYVELEAFGPIRKPSTTRVVLAVVAVMGTAFGIYQFVPWLRYSIVSGLLTLAGASETVVSRVIMVGVLLFAVLLTRVSSKSQSSGDGQKISGFMPPALNEELAFRTGCESWTWHQRVYSCISFGLMHIFNLIVPLSLTIALMIAGAIFMVVYLAEYKRTGSSEIATLVSARFHARYNDFALKLLVAAISLVMLVYVALTILLFF